MSAQQFREAKGCYILSMIICIGIGPHPMQFSSYYGGWNRERPSLLLQVKSSETKRGAVAELSFVCNPIDASAASWFHILTALRGLFQKQQLYNCTGTWSVCLSKEKTLNESVW